MLNKLPNDCYNGVLSLERIRRLPGYPDESGFEKGPVVVIECDEDIACNPCEDICPNGAITVGEPITNLPKVDIRKCNGCYACITICPGLCMFVVYKNFSETESLIYIPWEFIPLPEKGTVVAGCDRRGEQVCPVRVEKVLRAKKFQKTSIIAVSVPKKYFEIVRAIRY